jgi:hypothetical protein
MRELSIDTPFQQQVRGDSSPLCTTVAHYSYGGLLILKAMPARFASFRFQVLLLVATPVLLSFVITFSKAFAPQHQKQPQRRRQSFSKPPVVSLFAAVDPSSTAESDSSMSPATSAADCSTLTLLEHVNLNVPNPAETMQSFYWGILGCGMDPRKAFNMAPEIIAAPAGKSKTLWANCGASQFHLPYGATAQRIPGTVGLRYESLVGLKARLAASSAADSDSSQHSYEIAVGRNGQEVIHVTDCYGNVFHCRSGASREGSLQQQLGLRQPVISRSPTDTAIAKWGGDFAKQYGCDETDCRGIDYVEFLCPMQTAAKIALFYESVLDATTSVVQDGETSVAIIALGNVDENGKADQSLLFRESEEALPPYDGHHIAMYVGQSQADFEQAYKNADIAGVVWVNPRFSDKADTLQGAIEWKQFRFKDIIDIETGQKIFELEHEMRSIEHEAWPGKSNQ